MWFFLFLSEPNERQPVGFVLMWQCWLKRQTDPLDPEIHDSGVFNAWTSGLVFGKDVV